MRNHRPYHYETALLHIARQRLLKRGELDGGPRRAEALTLLREGYHALPERRRHQLRRAPTAKSGRPPPEELVEQLRLLLGIAGLHRWAERHHPRAMERLGAAATLAAWLESPPEGARTQEALRAGLREGLGIATDRDRKVIDARLGPLLRRSTMAFTYDFDPRGVPEGFDSDAFERYVDAVLRDTVPHVTPSMRRFVKGAMSIDGFLPQDRASQDKHIRDLRVESEQMSEKVDGSTWMNRDAYVKIDEAIHSVRGTPNGKTPTGLAYFEELAFVARELLASSGDVPIDAPGLRQRVAAALADYVAPDVGGTLSLPSLSGVDGQQAADLVPANIRAVGLIYAGWNLEEMKLFQVLDRVVEVFMNGQLPVGDDKGGRALSAYYFDPDEKRLTEAARRMTYSRVLGVPGGEVSREAPPNRAFQDLFMRFLGNVSEFDRQRRIDDVVGARARIDVLSNTGEQVRKAGFDLAANVSLYGFGGTFFVAQRLASQIERALRILSVPEIMSAYGVQSPFQVVERVCATDLGGTVPNVVRLKTMAEAGKDIMDVIAAHTAIWPSSNQPLFSDPLSVPIGGTVTPSRGPAAAPAVDIQPAVQERLVRDVEHWLAVNGIKDEQRARLGEPEVSQPAPSIPTVGSDGGGGAAFDQLRQMVSAGQTPSLDQLKALMPDAGGMVRV